MVESHFPEFFVIPIGFHRYPHICRRIHFFQNLWTGFGKGRLSPTGRGTLKYAMISGVTIQGTKWEGIWCPLGPWSLFGFCHWCPQHQKSCSPWWVFKGDSQGSLQELLVSSAAPPATAARNQGRRQWWLKSGMHTFNCEPATGACVMAGAICRHKCTIGIRAKNKNQSQLQTHW